VTNDHLLQALRDLARVLAADGITLTVGGGDGLFLRAVRGSRLHTRTRLAQPLPQRSTEDIDVFLDAEIVTSAARMSVIRSALDRLGYVPTVRYMQFAIPDGASGLSAAVKIDLLTGPIPESAAALVQVKDMRVRPVNAPGLHAYLTPEAFSLAQGRQEFEVGERDESVVVSVLHPFTYFVLKLFALRDRLDRDTDPKQRYHALDLFALWASLTEDEWNQVQEWSHTHAGERHLAEARSICRELFGHATARGMIALRDQMQRSNWTFEGDDASVHLEAFRRDLIALIAGAEAQAP
jgi:hypothetical protein